MNALFPSALAALALSGLAAAQGPVTLMFSTHQPERILLNTPPVSLQGIRPQDAAIVEPAAPVGSYSAAKFAPHPAYLTLAGDEDGDAAYFETVLPLRIDALVANHNASGRSMEQMFFSPQQQIDGAVSGVALKPGDVGRILPNGAFEFFLTEAQVRFAFQIPAAQAINVDAVEYDPRVAQSGAITQGRFLVYLSLEDNHTGVFHDVNGNVVANVATDGAILAIPVNALGTPVTGIGPGILVVTENGVDAMVNQSQIRDFAGAQPPVIVDTDGLTLDPNGGTFQTPTGIYPNLLFCGETLTGGGIVSTRFNGANFGQIAQLNGVPMGRTAGNTTGEQVGLRPNNVSSLNGLHATRLTGWSRLVLDSQTLLVPCPPGGTIQVDIGGGTPGVALLLIGIGTDVAASVVPMAPLVNPGFPAVILPVLAVPVGLAADGSGTFTAAIAPAAAPGVNLVFQAMSLAGGSAALSTPLTVELQ